MRQAMGTIAMRPCKRCSKKRECQTCDKYHRIIAKYKGCTPYKIDSYDPIISFYKTTRGPDRYKKDRLITGNNWNEINIESKFSWVIKYLKATKDKCIIELYISDSLDKLVNSVESITYFDTILQREILSVGQLKKKLNQFKLVKDQLDFLLLGCEKSLVEFPGLVEKIKQIESLIISCGTATK
jgi:hypothetical protein